MRKESRIDFTPNMSADEENDEIAQAIKMRMIESGEWHKFVQSLTSFVGCSFDRLVLGWIGNPSFRILHTLKTKLEDSGWEDRYVHQRNLFYLSSRLHVLIQMVENEESERTLEVSSLPLL